MNKFFESAMIALDAIWSSKLRSLMTVLGNIVAVTSIIAVVSLIQGLNASVKEAILNQAGADSFNIQQFPITRSDEEFEKVRSNPRITLQRRARDSALQRAGQRAVMARLERRRPHHLPATSRSTRPRITGVTGDYVNFSSFDAERGRLMSPTEVDTARPVTVIGWEHRRSPVRRQSTRSTRPSRSKASISASSASAPSAGSVLGRSQDEFAVIPLGQFQMMFGSRRQLSMIVKPHDVADMKAAMDETTVALRGARRLKPKQPDNFGILTSDTILEIYHSATNGIFAVLIGVVGLSLVVGGIVIMNIMLMVVSERTREIGLRKALGARKTDIMAQMLTESVVLSIFGGVIGTLLGAGDRHDDRDVHADSGVGRAVVDRPRHHDHGAGRPVLRAVSGDARGAAWIRSKR